MCTLLAHEALGDSLVGNSSNSPAGEFYPVVAAAEESNMCFLTLFSPPQSTYEVFKVNTKTPKDLEQFARLKSGDCVELKGEPIPPPKAFTSDASWSNRTHPLNHSFDMENVHLKDDMPESLQGACIEFQGAMRPNDLCSDVHDLMKENERKTVQGKPVAVKIPFVSPADDTKRFFFLVVTCEDPAKGTTFDIKLDVKGNDKAAVMEPLFAPCQKQSTAWEFFQPTEQAAFRKFCDLFSASDPRHAFLMLFMEQKVGRFVGLHKMPARGTYASQFIFAKGEIKNFYGDGVVLEDDGLEVATKRKASDDDGAAAPVKKIRSYDTDSAASSSSSSSSSSAEPATTSAAAPSATSTPPATSTAALSAATTTSAV